MRFTPLGLSLLALVAGCSKPADVAQSSSTEPPQANFATASAPASQAVLSDGEAMKQPEPSEEFPLPEDQKKFLAMVSGLPEIPADIYGTRREDTFVAETNKTLGDYELQKVRTYDYYVEPKPGKTGLSEVKDWMCKAHSKKEADEEFGACDLVGIPYSSGDDFFWNRGSNFKPNQKYYAGDLLKISARVKSMVIFHQGAWHYKIELQDGSFDVVKEAK